MKNIVDSCGWLEYFADASNAGKFATAIEDTKNLIVPSICIYEVFKRVYQQRGEDAALQAISVMYHGEIAAIDDVLALSSAKISIEYKLPVADSIIFAVSRQRKAKLWTQDDDFKHIEEVNYIEKRQTKE